MVKKERKKGVAIVIDVVVVQKSFLKVDGTSGEGLHSYHLSSSV
jgi:hypothetical protein